MNQLQTHVIPWIVHRFIQPIQGGCVQTSTTWNWIHKYGATICFNGWDSVARHPLFNIMFDCPNGDIFIGSIDATREQKDAHYICNALGGYIKTIHYNKTISFSVLKFNYHDSRIKKKLTT
jgi:hypothetical protein